MRKMVHVQLQTLVQRWIRHLGIGFDCFGFVLHAAIRAREAVRNTASFAGFLAPILGLPTVPFPLEISPRERNAASFRRGLRVRRPTAVIMGFELP
jgi:hypothetical protein